VCRGFASTLNVDVACAGWSIPRRFRPGSATRRSKGRVDVWVSVAMAVDEMTVSVCVVGAAVSVTVSARRCQQAVASRACGRCVPVLVVSRVVVCDSVEVAAGSETVAVS
jgi:hypothetical protein